MSAVLEELLGAGHAVLGLARSDASADILSAVGAQVHRGSLEDHDTLRAGAAKADGVVHTPFSPDLHDFAGLQRRHPRAAGMGADAPGLLTDLEAGFYFQR